MRSWRFGRPSEGAKLPDGPKQDLDTDEAVEDDAIGSPMGALLVPRCPGRPAGPSFLKDRPDSRVPNRRRAIARTTHHISPVVWPGRVRPELRESLGKAWWLFTEGPLGK